jgi:demethylmenaquinone methyltransferase/2-methoxy-6-polyprenyl-1,4-benzoquinol methylase
MSTFSGEERSQYVQAMFTRIAGRYDLMNRLMTFGQDKRWRKEVIRLAGLPPKGRILDLGAGTGDLALEALKRHPDSKSVAADFTLEMMQVGKAHPERRGLQWCAADALHLPYSESTFDAAVSGFLLRNVADISVCLREQLRVLKPGGRMVALDTTRPHNNPLMPLIDFHLHTVIPTLGEIITGEREAYTYLPESTEAFLSAETLAGRMVEAGFQEVGFRRLMFGTIAIHWGTR